MQCGGCGNRYPTVVRVRYTDSGKREGCNVCAGVRPHGWTPKPPSLISQQHQAIKLMTGRKYTDPNYIPDRTAHEWSTLFTAHQNRIDRQDATLAKRRDVIASTEMAEHMEQVQMDDLHRRAKVHEEELCKISAEAASEGIRENE